MASEISSFWPYPRSIINYSQLISQLIHNSQSIIHQFSTIISIFSVTWWDIMVYQATNDSEWQWCSNYNQIFVQKSTWMLEHSIYKINQKNWFSQKFIKSMF